MSIEAARQLISTHSGRALNITLTNLRFPASIPSFVFKSDKSKGELCLTLTASEETDVYRLTISTTTGEVDTPWTICCIGSLQLLKNDIIPAIREPRYIPSVSHHDETTGSTHKKWFDTLLLKNCSATGRLATVDADSELPVNPLPVASLLQVPGMLMLTTGPPAQYRIQSVSSLTVLTTSANHGCSPFWVQQSPLPAAQSTTDLQVSNFKRLQMTLEGIRTRTIQFTCLQPPLKSLFFTPEFLPDISSLNKSDPLGVSSLLRLVTHKWPMCDIGIGDTSPADLQHIRAALTSSTTYQRLQYRSLSLMDSQAKTKNERDRVCSNFDNEHFHILFGKLPFVSQHAACIRPFGICCALMQTEHDRMIFDSKYELICEVKGLHTSGWFLGRLRMTSIQQDDNSRLHSLHVITTTDLGYAPSGLKLTNLQDHALPKLNKHKSDSPMDLIFLDCAERSLLISWSGGQFLSWLQPLLQRTRNLVWVTKQLNADPFTGIAGSFTKTIRSENPLVHTVSLTIKDNMSSVQLLDSAILVYKKLISGSHETELIIRNSQICTLRYQPDDVLSTLVGLLPPQTAHAPLQTKDYEIHQAPSNQAIFLCGQKNSQSELDESLITVEASVIDYIDASHFWGADDAHLHQFTLGQFFAGTIRRSDDSTHVSGSLVTGWHIGAHRSRVQTSNSHLHKVPESMAMAQAVMHTAAYSIAVAIIEGVARPRPDEKIDIQISGVLGQALHNVSRSLGIAVLENGVSKADITITFTLDLGFQVNGRRASPTKYLKQAWLHFRVKSFWSHEHYLHTHPRCFNLDEAQEAFQLARHYPTSTVLLHRGKDRPVHILFSRITTATKFRADTVYVVAGGLGGIGRYVLNWIASHGAKYIITLSRQGSASKDFGEALQATRKLGASLEAYAVDVCNFGAVQEVFNKIRTRGPIGGCINMVLQLANCPLSTMTADQWDTAVRAKVESSWNLHQATLEDELDTFIMLSSISSICGNRTQANYAVGNSFQNALAQYRKTLGRPALTIALGAMKEVGVLAEDTALLKTLSQSGLACLDLNDLDKVLEAAIQNPDYSLICTGLEMFQRRNGIIQCSNEQNQLFWAEWPDFSTLIDHTRTDSTVSAPQTLIEQLESCGEASARSVLLRAFSECLSNILGKDATFFCADTSLASCGLDSLNAVSCRYWFYKRKYLLTLLPHYTNIFIELKVDVPIFDILGCKTLDGLLSRVLAKIKHVLRADLSTRIQEPIDFKDRSLDYRPLSHSQNRLWFLQTFLNDKTVNNLLLECYVSGEVKIPAFLQAWTVFLQRHEVLRSRIQNTSRGPQQLPIKDMKFPLTVIDASSESFPGDVHAIRKCARTYNFNLETGDLIRGWLLVSPDHTRFLLASHHIAWDRASVKTVFAETTAIYRAIRRGLASESTLFSVSYQFIHYTLWQNTYLQNSKLVEPMIDYWKKQLFGISQAISLLPTASKQERPAMKQYEFGHTESVLDATLTSSLRAFCKKSAVTPFMFMASALTLLIHRLNGDRDIVVGIADGDRGHTAFDDLVGFTVNMLPICAKLHSEMLYEDFLEDYRQTCLSAY